MNEGVSSTIGWVARLVIAALLASASAGPMLVVTHWTARVATGHPLIPASPSARPAATQPQQPSAPLTAKTVGVLVWLGFVMVTLVIGAILVIGGIAGAVTLMWGFFPVLAVALLLDLAARRMAWLRAPWPWMVLGAAAMAPMGPRTSGYLLSTTPLGSPWNLVPAAIAGAGVGAVLFYTLRGGWRSRTISQPMRASG